MLLKNKAIVVSGASQGFGLAVTRAFLAEGANVAICSRQESEIKKVAEELVLEFPKQIIIAMAVDVSIPEDVQRFTTNVLDKFRKIDVWVANAGIYGPKGKIESLNWEEWSKAIDINLKGTVLQCRAVVPQMRIQKQGKIIILSGGGATKPMPYLSAYATSKAAVVRFAETLAEEVREDNIQVNTIAPGALNTRLLNEILDAGPEQVGDKFYQDALKQKETGGASLELGTSLCVYLASDQSKTISGKLISAIWDPWQSFEKHTEELQKTDIYTLRRIVPSDRGMDWEI